jgi:hypothetical protein
MAELVTPKKLPLDGPTFAEIMDQNLLYVDKTEYIYNLFKKDPDHYFLTRPHRFGKTLLLSTIETLFSGDREPFQDLWIGQSDYDFPKHPVLY